MPFIQSCQNNEQPVDIYYEDTGKGMPVVFIHSDDDKTVPIKATGDQSVKIIAGAMYKVYDGAPHGLWFTEQEKLTRTLSTLYN